MIRKFATSLLCGVLLLAAAPAAAQGTSANVPVSATVQGGYLNLARVGGSSNVVFPNTEIQPTTQTVYATQAPQFTITDATGTRNGWHLTLNASNFSSGNNHINASNARWSGRGGYSDGDDDFVVVNGDNTHYNWGPRDYTNGHQALNSTQKIVTTPAGWGAGTYTWSPTPGKFVLLIPPTTKGGGTTYTATYTLTLLTGP